MNLSQHRPITEQELAELVAGMDQAEQSGMFDGLFCRKQQEPTLEGTSKEQLIQSISSTMSLTRSFFKRVYGYEISYPGFADQAIEALEAAGCSRARSYYEEINGAYQRQQDDAIRPVAEEYVRDINKKRDQKEGEEQREWKREKLLRQKKALLMLKSKELIGN